MVEENISVKFSTDMKMNLIVRKRLYTLPVLTLDFRTHPRHWNLSISLMGPKYEFYLPSVGSFTWGPQIHFHALETLVGVWPNSLRTQRQGFGVQALGESYVIGSRF